MEDMYAGGIVMETKGLKMNFLGDSITQNVGASDEDHGYVAVAAQLMELKEARNYGVSGTRIAFQTDGCQDFLETFYNRALRMEEDADAVFVFGGTNDFGHGSAPLGSFGDRTQETFYGALCLLMELLLQKYPCKPIVFATPLHRVDENSDCGDGSKPNGSLRLSVYADVIREVTAYYGIPLLDLMKVSMIQPECDFIREQICPDGLHPSDLGHRMIGERVAGFFKSL